MSFKKKDDDVIIDKMTVYQDCILNFNASPIQARECRILLARLMYLLSVGETFPRDEATQMFFSITKLFQHKDVSLRQMVYLVIKELAPIANDVIMVTSSIMKDTASGSDTIYRPNAIRSLIRIIDASTVQAIERLIKTSIVDRNPSVSSAALVGSYHLIPIAKDIVRRWANETQETVLAYKPYPSSIIAPNSSNFSNFSSSSLNSSTAMTQYHALGLLYEMRAHDHVALIKMIQQFSGSGQNSLRSPAAIIMLIRFLSRVISDDRSMRKAFFVLLDSWLKHKADTVNIEAAKTILEINDVTDTEAAPAINVLQVFLSSPRYVSRFAAIRILNKFAMKRPSMVNVCNIEIENLISDSNRSIATYAITTLLKTGNEASIDRLIKQISGFMSEITDEFKVIIVDAIRSLCLKFPSKQAGMLQFLSSLLRDDGGYDFKLAVIEAIFDLVKYVPEAKEEALSQLSEFIEDCEFTKLAVRVLHFLGQEGPYTSQPTKYIRYIYNRIVLENALIRAAAVTALSKFYFIKEDGISYSVKVLLQRSLEDPDDEVRDRASIALKVLSFDESSAKTFIAPDKYYSLSILENQLTEYVTSRDKLTFSKPFDFAQVPLISHEEALAEARLIKQSKNSSLGVENASLEAVEPETGVSATKAIEGINASYDRNRKFAAELGSIDEFKSYGSLLHSSNSVELTERETEYFVSAYKHLFNDHLVLQFDVKNTLPDTLLENVIVNAIPEIDDDSPDLLEEEFTIPIEKLSPLGKGTVYISYKRPANEFVTISFANSLKFTSKDIDPSTGEAEEEGYEDEYSVEDLDLTVGDYIVPLFVGDFNHLWDEFSNNEASQTYSLSSVSTIQEAVDSIIELLGMQALEGTEYVSNPTSHTLKLSGKTIFNTRGVAQVRLVCSSSRGVSLKITSRAEDDNLSELIASSIA